MFALVSVHTPEPEHRDAVIDSMHRFGAALRGPGLVDVRTMADADSERLIGWALFESAEAAQERIPAARAAIADDDFDTWEVVEMDGFRLTDV